MRVVEVSFSARVAVDPGAATRAARLVRGGILVYAGVVLLTTLWDLHYAAKFHCLIDWDAPGGPELETLGVLAFLANALLTPPLLFAVSSRARLERSVRWRVIVAILVLWVFQWWAALPFFQ